MFKERIIVKNGHSFEKKTRRAAAVAVFVFVGLFSSVAFGSFVAAEPSTTTTEATATSSDATSTDGSATTTDASSTDEGTTTSPSFFPTTTTTSSDSTNSQDPSLAYYLVKFTSTATEKKQEDAIAAVGATDLSRIAPLSLHSISVPIDSAQTAVDALRANDIVARVDSDKTREVSATANDPDYGQQWSLPRIGWDTLHDNVAVSGAATVAVLDTGVDATHEDLQRQLVTGTSILDGSAGTTDPNGHGTEMAGIVAAATDNSLGIAGVGYAGVKVMPVTVLGADGTGQDSDVIEGVVWAVAHNADVILMSFSNPGFSQSLQDAIDYAWANNVVVVAATGNDASSVAQFPAGDRGVIGVSNTDTYDNLNGSSNYGDDTFLAAPGTDIFTTMAGGGYASVTGTSASAAMVAGAAALLRATSVGASNGVIVSRLAKNADAAGTATQTGNGRLNLGRAALDTSSDSIEPAGAAPVGSGGPYVGPYVVANNVSGNLQGQSNPACTTPSPCPWQGNQLTGWAELQTAPLRLDLPSGQQNDNPGTFTISIDHAANGTAGLESLTNFAASSNVTVIGGIPGGIVFSTSNGGDTWNYTFTVDMTDNNEGFVTFNTRPRAGAHAFGGASLQVKGASTLQFIKPAAAPGTPDLTLTKSALSSVSPGQTFTYTLQYQNVATGSNSATGVQLTDTLPSNATYVANSCTGSCTYDSVSKTLTWNLGTIPAGSALATQTFQVTVDPTTGSVSNTAQILSAENDATPGNNTATKSSSIVAPAISGTVLTDPNGDGIDQGDGTGLAGATLTLYLDNAVLGTFDTNTDTQVGSAITTSASGDWAFTSGLLANKTYWIVVTSPSGYTTTQAIPEAVASGTDGSTATKDAINRLKVAFTNVTGPYSSNNRFLGKVTNTAATAVNDSYSTNEDTPLSVAAPGVLGNDTDAESNPLTAALVSGPTHSSSFTLNPNGSFSYTPAANYSGSDTFTYKANDGSLDSNVATVTITVNAVNDAPVANADSYSTNEDTPLTVAAAGVLSNDTDIEGSTLSVGTPRPASGPSHGSLTLNADGSFSYTPNANYNGPDSFTYFANDGTVNSASAATVSITVNPVNDAPLCSDQSGSTPEDTPLNSSVTCSDVDSASLTYSKVSDPANGSVTVNADGTFTYTPNANFNGNESFTFKANDGSLNSNTATYTINVTAVNDAPVAANDSYSTNEDTTLSVAAPGVLGNDTDVDGPSLSAVLVSGPAHASSFALNADGSFSYTPAANYNGTDSFTYKASDGSLQSSTATVSLTINPVNDAALCSDQGGTTPEDTPLNSSVTCSDVDSASLTYSKVSDPANGSVTVNPNGTFAYTPDANFNGNDSFTFKANDGSLDSNTATYTVNVTAVNDAPVAVNDAYVTDEDTPLVIPSAGVLANDSDVDGDAVSAVLNTGPSHGSLTLNADGSFSYSPDANYNGPGMRCRRLSIRLRRTAACR